MAAHMVIPVRGQVATLENGHSRISISINGRVSLVFDHDPVSHTLTEIPTDHDPTEHRLPFDHLETKAAPVDHGPIGDH